MTAKKPLRCRRLFSARSWRLLSGTVLLVCLSWVWEPQAGEVYLFRSLKADRARVYQGKPGSGGGHPLVCRLKNGEILAAFQAWNGHWDRSDWRVLSARSKDGGLHWSEPRVLVDSQNSEGNLALGVLKNGTVLLGYETFRLLTEKDALPSQFLAYEFVRSTDHGRSWSRPVKVPRNDELALASYSSIIQLPDGTALAPLYAYIESKEDEKRDSPSKKHFSYTYRSSDGGRTWGDRSLIAAGFNETNLVLLKSGKLLAVMREEQKPPGRCAIAESADGGRHWSSPRYVTGAREHPASILQMPNGTVIMSYGVRHAPYGAQALLSEDQGQTWDQNQKIMLGYNSVGGGGYPCTIRLESGRLLTLYYGSSGPFPFVEAVRWRLP